MKSAHKVFLTRVHASCFGLKCDNLWSTVTLKIRSWSLKSNHLLSMSQWYTSCKIDENLPNHSRDVMHTRNCHVNTNSDAWTLTQTLMGSVPKTVSPLLLAGVHNYLEATTHLTLWKTYRFCRSLILLYDYKLTFAILWANSADNILMIFFLFFPENRIRHFMQIVSNCMKC